MAALFMKAHGRLVRQIIPHTDVREVGDDGHGHERTRKVLCMQHFAHHFVGELSWRLNTVYLEISISPH